MIVVDANIVAYSVIEGKFTGVARQMARLSPTWVAPLFCRYELANILWFYVKRGALPAKGVTDVWNAMASVFYYHEHEIEVPPIVRLANERDISTYDAQYVALAKRLEVPLITEDKKLRSRCPDETYSMHDYIQHIEGS